MRNIEKWLPTRLVRDERTGGFKVNPARTFGGSLYLAELQRRAYLPVFAEHISGVLLDVGCGPAPYYEVYKPLITEVICLDHPGSVHGLEHLDHLVDLNTTERLPFPDGHFDTVLATDMIIHMQMPSAFVHEVARVLKPGGKAIITSTFVNWMGEYPNEFSHQSGPGLRNLAERAGLEVIHLKTYGGHADVLMDTLNKFMNAGLSNRLFMAFARFVIWTGWPARNRARTGDRYAIGNTMVVRKRGG